MRSLNLIFPDVDAPLVARFAAYHAAHPTVFDEFERRSFKMRNAGRTRYSQWTIIQAIRWHHDLESAEPFKINNDFIALYARLMIHEHPEFLGFFELRLMKTSGRAMSHEEMARRA
jgi:hypothetical protein